MDLIVFEDAGYDRFLPLTLTRPVFDLKCGMSSLGDKVLRAYGREHSGLLCRGYLAGLVAEQHPASTVNQPVTGSALLINGRALWTKALAAAVPLSGEDSLYRSGDVVVAARLSGDNLTGVDWSGPLATESLPDLPSIEVDATLVTWPWDLIHHNSALIASEFADLAPTVGGLEGDVSPGAHLINKEAIYVAPGAKVAPTVVLDASGGPIFIDEGATIMPQSTITGPAYIGKGSTIKVGAKIYAGTSIGEVCKIGGEVGESIIHSYSNKQHDGFLGHAYVGQWVNLGAGTSNSDLKNDYGIVRVEIGGETIDTGLMFVGATIGDHSKTGIQTALNTGAIVGIGCNLYGAVFHDKCVPSFTWGEGGAYVEYRLEKFIRVARSVMARRKQELSTAEESMLREVFSLTAAERKMAGVA